MSQPKESIKCYPDLMGLSTEIRNMIFRRLLGIDNCRDESEDQAWVDGYQQTGNHFLSPGVAPQSWLFNKSAPPSNTDSCISGSSPWKVKLDIHPAILYVSKQLASEGRAFIASENIFIKIHTDIPRYDIHLRKFGLPVFTYRPRTDFEQWYWPISQKFRTIVDIDMQTGQRKPIFTPNHFYLVLFKDIDQVIRALYLTNGREKASFGFMINIERVPAYMRPNIEGHMTDLLSSFRPVGSISITTNPARGFSNPDVLNSLTAPFDRKSFVEAVKTLTGIRQSVEAPILVLPEAERKCKAVNQLSRLSALFTQNRPFLASSPPQATKFVATLASVPLYNLLHLEYAAAAASTNNVPKWQLTVLPLSVLLLSLPQYFHNRRIYTLQIFLHTLNTLDLEVQASRVLFDLLSVLRTHVWEQNNFTNNAAASGAGAGQAALNAAAAAETARRGLTLSTILLISGANSTLETGSINHGEFGMRLMRLWQMLCRDGLAVVERSTMIVGQNGVARKTTLEDVWRVSWNGDFA
jgi:hypothetical protein